MKELTNSNIKIFSRKNIILLLILIFIVKILYTAEYSVQSIIMRFMANIIIFKLIFDESVYKIIVLFALIMLINTAGDIINTSIMMNFYSLDQIRTVPKVMLLANSIALIFT